MIHYIVALNDSDTYSKWLKPSLEKLQAKSVLEVGNDLGNSMFSKYNYALSNIKFEETDILAFIHEDVRILDENFEKKIEMVFEKRQNVGILGVIGTKCFTENGGWWLSEKEHHVGHIQQQLNNGTDYHMVKKIGYFEDVVSVDGCAFFMSGKMARSFEFDAATFPEKYHFYDVDACFSALQMGFGVAVADIYIHHKSEGPMPPSWLEARVAFLKKWKDLGVQFPAKVSNFQKP